MPGQTLVTGLVRGRFCAGMVLDRELSLNVIHGGDFFPLKAGLETFSTTLIDGSSLLYGFHEDMR